MKAKVKRGTAAGNLYCGLSTLCDVTCYLKLCETIATDCECTRFGWEESNGPASLQLCLSANSSFQSTLKAITVEVDHQWRCLWQRVDFFMRYLLKFVTGFLFVFISFVAAWLDVDVMT